MTFALLPIIMHEMRIWRDENLMSSSVHKVQGIFINILLLPSYLTSEARSSFRLLHALSKQRPTCTTNQKEKPSKRGQTHKSANAYRIRVFEEAIQFASCYPAAAQHSSIIPKGRQIFKPQIFMIPNTINTFVKEIIPAPWWSCPFNTSPLQNHRVVAPLKHPFSILTRVGLNRGCFAASFTTSLKWCLSDFPSCRRLAWPTFTLPRGPLCCCYYYYYSCWGKSKRSVGGCIVTIIGLRSILPEVCCF